MFKQFVADLQNHFEKNMKGGVLVTLDIPKELMWDKYLNSIPERFREIYISKLSDDCNCCRSFINNYGGVASLFGDKMVYLWDFETNENYNPSVKAMLDLQKKSNILSLLHTETDSAGTEQNTSEEKKDTFFHLYINDLAWEKNLSPNVTIQNKKVLQRGLEEVTLESIYACLELAREDNLYRASVDYLETLRKLKEEYESSTNKEEFLWHESYRKSTLCGFRNTLLGTLLVDLSEGENFEIAVKKYEDKASGENYKRKKPLLTEKQKQECLKTLNSIGLTESLIRRFAELSDIDVANVIFANRDLGKTMKGIETLLTNAPTTNPKNLKSETTISKEEFIELTKKAKDVKVKFDTKLIPQLFGMTYLEEGKSPFKWGNNFAWAYKGGIADSSIKQKVKEFGGKTDVPLRFSIMWNEELNETCDLDNHADITFIDGRKEEVNFRNGHSHRGDIRLDIDIISPNRKIAVENIYVKDIDEIEKIDFRVNLFSGRLKGDYKCEIELEGEVRQYTCNDFGSNDFKEVCRVERVDGKLRIVDKVDSKISNQTVWGISTGSYIPVSAILKSPNTWNKKDSNEHLFLCLDQCQADESLNGFFNEFLIEELKPYSRVMEYLSNKTLVKPTEKSLCGLGFQSTRRFEISTLIDNRPYQVQL